MGIFEKGGIVNEVDHQDSQQQENYASLNEASENSTYTIKHIQTNDAEMESFLFSLGCFAGEAVSVISKLEKNVIITIKGARYSIDSDLASAILVDI